MPTAAKEINKFWPSLLDPCAQTNTPLPISRLPPETLAHIFTLGAHEYHENTDCHEFRIPDWVNASYVCRYWRDVALGCATLWTYHFTVSLRWTEELLARSKQASLKIRVRFDLERRAIPWWTDLLVTLLSHVDRMQELSLRVPSNVLPPILSLRAPRLQVLDIDYDDYSHPNWYSIIDDVGIPPLRILRLVRHSLPWYSFNLSGVTTLYLDDVPCPFQQNTPELLATLNCMPCLTELHLDYVLASAQKFLSSGVYRASPKVNLPRLSRLLVVAPLSAVIALLSLVNIPSKTKLRLAFKWEDGCSAADYAQISSILAQTLNRPEDPPSFGPTIHSLGINYLPTLSFCASGDDYCLSYESMEYGPDWDSNHPLILSVITIGPLSAIEDDIVADICCSIPCLGVQSLSILGPSVSLDFWKKVLGQLPRLRRIQLEDGCMPDLASLLALTTDELADDYSQTPRHIFVPALESLRLDGINFATEDGVSKESLLDALHTRKPLRPQLIMRCCRVDGVSLAKDDNGHNDCAVEDLFVDEFEY